MKKDKTTNNDLQNTTQKTKDWATRTPLKTGGELRCSGRVRSTGTICGTHDDRIIYVTMNKTGKRQSEGSRQLSGNISN